MSQTNEQRYREAAKEMDALAYAVLDCFPVAFNKKWLTERKADYARLHAELEALAEPPQATSEPEYSQAEALKEAQRRAKEAGCEFAKADNDGGWMRVAWATKEGIMHGTAALSYREAFKVAFLVAKAKEKEAGK